MTTITTIIIFASVALLAAANTYMELRRDLMMYQQNSYRNERYRRWLSSSGDSTSRWRLCGLTIFLISLVRFSPQTGSMILVGIFCAAQAVSLIRRRYKKPLVMTARATRLLCTSCAISLLAVAAATAIFADGTAASILFTGTTALLGCYCASHLLMMLSGILLTPVEKAINRRYWRDAAARLEDMPDLTVIGITGSYGKTTTKHYLHRILSEQFDTLMTPGSYNTTLGVVRTVREMLKPYHQVFIVEMGAKQLGDIKEICDLVHPHYAIITAVGPQHLESFKTIENVQSTKFELADALPADGLVALNDDFEKIADRPVDNTRSLRYAVKNADGADIAYSARDIEYTPTGTSFDVLCHADGSRLHLTTRLVGECNISNILGAVVIARTLGVPDEKIRRAVEKIEQVEHRLSIKRIPGGLTIIDDAFNSNPVGSAMALDVLGAMTGGKRVLVTPGMIELGQQQYELNFRFGELAAAACDLAVVVGRYNREAISEGLRKGGMPEEDIRTVDTFADAQAVLAAETRGGDIVLYENDLPDTFK